MNPISVTAVEESFHEMQDKSHLAKGNVSFCTITWRPSSVVCHLFTFHNFNRLL
jgi:hypothetical protein